MFPRVHHDHDGTLRTDKGSVHKPPVSRYSTVTEPLESIDEVRNMPWFDETKSAVIKERGLEKKTLQTVYWVELGG